MVLSRLLASLFLAAAGAPACAGPSTPAAELQKLAATAVVLDVRNPDEWNAGHLDRSTLIPLPELEARLAEVDALVGGDKAKPVIVVCRSGGRAGKAKTLLEARGYTHVVNGGAWQSLQPTGGGGAGG
jgi:rhodanese-related sulfurtransferase